MNNYNIGSVVFGNWAIKKEIGEGSFGKVYEIQRMGSNYVYRAALKVIRVPRNEAELSAAMAEGMNLQEAREYFKSVVEDIERECAIMSELKGTANIVGYEDHMVIENPKDVGWEILIRMELLTPLLDYAKRNPFTRRDAIKLGIDICKALELCQKYNVIHRDIKPENIFVSQNGDFKLGDFGIARTIEKTTSGLSKKGTYTYMAPEAYRGAEYGFSVDIYSLGIVLYRLLNKNRGPFLPEAPAPITYSNREQALAKRMGGEAIPAPFYHEGRLSEIVLKACAFDPKERYSSPGQMRQELEAILYDENDASFIYPNGDELILAENQYVSGTAGGYVVVTSNSSVSRKKKESNGDSENIGGTVGDFGRLQRSNEDCSEEAELVDPGTISDFGAKGGKSTQKGTGKTGENEGTKSDFKPKGVNSGKTDIGGAKIHPEKSKKSKLPMIVAGGLCAVAIVGGCIGMSLYRNAKYDNLVEEALTYCKTEPQQAVQMFEEAQRLSSKKKPDAYVGQAYALYCARDYDACIDYITNELNQGRDYELQVQSELSAIMASAYFEKGDYTEAAVFYFAAANNGELDVAAMRDYAVSLGRTGDVEAANEKISEMIEAGADDFVTEYVQAEINYALEKYVAAESGFKKVLDGTTDEALQKRAMRSLAEVYRECAALENRGASPIAGAAQKEIEVLEEGIEKYGLQYDATLWEMLGMAYNEAADGAGSNRNAYLNRTSECFEKVIELGIQKEYLYANVFIIYHELGNYTAAEEALKKYEEQFPNDYMPHALRGVMLISAENEKSEDNRNYEAAYSEYSTAKSMIQGDDDATYFQMLEGYINELISGGWL